MPTNCVVQALLRSVSMWNVDYGKDSGDAAVHVNTGFSATGPFPPIADVKKDILSRPKDREPRAFVYPAGAKEAGKTWLASLVPPANNGEKRQRRREGAALRERYPNADQLKVLTSVVKRCTTEALEERRSGGVQGQQATGKRRKKESEVNSSEPERMLLHGGPGTGKS